MTANARESSSLGLLLVLFCCEFSLLNTTTWFLFVWRGRLRDCLRMHLIANSSALSRGLVACYRAGALSLAEVVLPDRFFTKGVRSNRSCERAQN